MAHPTNSGTPTGVTATPIGYTNPFTRVIRAPFNSMTNMLQTLTPFEKISVLMSIVNLVTFLFLWDQTNQVSNTLSSTASQSIMSQQLQLDQIFIDKPELRPYFYAVNDQVTPLPSNLTTPEDQLMYSSIMALADLKLDYFYTVYDQSRYISDFKNAESEESLEWQRYLVDSFNQSPAMCQRIIEVRGWYPEAIFDIARKGCRITMPPKAQS
jgi:hypothetical protein